MNADIKGWLENVRNPILKLLLGLLILFITGLLAEKVISETRERKSLQEQIAKKDGEVERLMLKYDKCKDEKYEDVKRQSDRLEMRTEKQDSAIKILSKQ